MSTPKKTPEPWQRVRPPAFASAEEMRAQVERYFDDVFSNMEAVRLGDPVKVDRVTNDFRPTITGLCLSLGITRQTLWNYIRDDEGNYAEGIQKVAQMAKLMVENALEHKLYDAGCNGAIFNLKSNFGWEDKSVIDHQNSDQSMRPDAAVISADTVKLLVDKLTE